MARGLEIWDYKRGKKIIFEETSSFSKKEDCGIVGEEFYKRFLKGFFS